MIPKPTCSVLAAGLVVAAVAGTSGTNDRLAVWWWSLAVCWWLLLV
jgi:hypothetical protein